jgi:hypothetical protein
MKMDGGLREEIDETMARIKLVSPMRAHNRACTETA